MALLDVNNLTIRFGGLTAVSQLNFQVQPGQIFAVIGPNGAGKTTVFNSITGIYEPTEGKVLFEGQEQQRPLDWKVLVGCVLIGLVTGLAAMLIYVNVDRLWQVTIKRNTIPGKPFSYSAAWNDLWGQLRGDLVLEKHPRRERWTIVSADGRHQLSDSLPKAQAEAAMANVQALVALPREKFKAVERNGEWVVLSEDGSKALVNYPSQEVANYKLRAINEVALGQASLRRNVPLAFVLGTVLGAAGCFAVWQRARRTPDVIALGGIARTFQNIRLFHNMTVLENVLIGMDRFMHGGLFRIMLRTPGIRAEERQKSREACELLEFVGLKDKADMLAKNLPYGDQRRLEIARALAAKPRLVLLDEPAAGMNPFETGSLMELIRRIRDKGVTVLLIEHHMKLVMGISDRIAVLDHGVKIAEGTPQEVRDNPQVIEAYLGKEEVH